MKQKTRLIVFIYFLIVIHSSVILYADDFADIKEIFDSPFSQRYKNLQKFMTNNDLKLQKLIKFIEKESQTLKSNSISINSKFYISLEILKHHYYHGGISGKSFINTLALKMNDNDFLHLNKPEIYRYPVLHFLSEADVPKRCDFFPFIFFIGENKPISNLNLNMLAKYIILTNDKCQILFGYDKANKMLQNGIDFIKKHQNNSIIKDEKLEKELIQVKFNMKRLKKLQNILMKLLKTKSFWSK